MNLNILLFVLINCTITIFGIDSTIVSKEILNHTDYFKLAKPIWPSGRQLEKNLTVGFRADFKLTHKENVLLKITGSSLYRIFLNGNFIGHGPARSAHGYYRIDELDLTNSLVIGTNILAIEVVGYNVNSYYLLDQPSFIQAEVIVGNNVILATNNTSEDFQALKLPERVQKVPRYSFQRPFIECYRLSQNSNKWRTAISSLFQSLRCNITESKKLLPRRIKYSTFNKIVPKTILAHGKVKTGVKQNKYWETRAVNSIGEKLGGYKKKDLVINPAVELQEMKNVNMIKDSISYTNSINIDFAKDTYKIFDFEYNASGFIGAQINCEKPGRLYLVFDEILVNEDVDFKRLSCMNVITYDLEPGIHNIESFEPYTLKYLKIIMTGGKSKISNIYLREYVNPDTENAKFVCSDKNINNIYKAGVETFKQNAVDIFMDCPSRERAGWLCDSYFTARVAQDLSGNSIIEKNFIENFLLPSKFENIPEGMLHMCYPADHYDSVFIPNWSLWFVIQLEEYSIRSNDKQMISDLKPKILNLFKYFDNFINEDGLLEKLESWVFVEWSKANNFVQDVNYPSNMLYYAALNSASKLYNLPQFKEKAELIKSKIIEQSFNDQFFIDNAVRNTNGDLELTDNISEVCQYYAFYFNVATIKSHPKLWDKLLINFGPERHKNNLFKNVHFANSFPGNYLRLELLSRYKITSKLLNESKNFFNYMAERTGTLWENISPTASCNHGFASHIVHLLYRDVLGINNIDRVNKIVTFQFSDIGIKSCKGSVPIGNDSISLEWELKNNKIIYNTNVPKEYNIEIVNLTDLPLIKD